MIANRIVEQVIVPRFRNGEFYGGLNEAVTRMIALIEGEPLPEPRSSARRRSNDRLGKALPLLLMFVFVGSGICADARHVGGASPTAGVAAAIVWVLTSTIVVRSAQP